MNLSIIIVDTLSKSDTIPSQLINQSQTFIEAILNPNTIIALTAVVVSIAAIIFSILYNRKSLNITRRHNKLSVEPILETNYTVGSDSVLCKLELVNKGLGPAIVKSIVYKTQSRKYTNMAKLLTSLYPDFVKEYLHGDSRYNIMEGGITVSPGVDTPLFYLKPNKPNAFKKIKNILRDVVVVIDYQTIYKDQKVFSTYLGFENL